MTKTSLKVSEIKNNPNNPRLIKDDKFKKLVASIKEFPEMLDAREIVVNKDHIILGGNMRFKAAKEAGLKEVPVKIVDWPDEYEPNFEWRDVKVWWYKYLGRGTYANKELTPEIVNEMLNDCLNNISKESKDELEEE